MASRLERTITWQNGWLFDRYAEIFERDYCTDGIVPGIQNGG